ncbi:hypothetical protein BD769DRAFT_1643762 [Suillus cothurnatus]|nr:hypothetical protein BD769DRAFT_1643762 [Suillus cothurnatus]
MRQAFKALQSHVNATSCHRRLSSLMSANLQYILDESQQICDTCGCSFKPKGFDSHQRACERRMRDSEEDVEKWASIPAMSIQAVVPALTVQAAHDDDQPMVSRHVTQSLYSVLSLNCFYYIIPNPRMPLDTLSMISTQNFTHMQGSQHVLKLSLTSHDTTIMSRPAQNASLGSHSGVNLTLSRTEDFTLANYVDVRNMWEAASHHLTPFEQDTITVPLGDKDMEYTVHFRPLWEWARLSKFDGDSFVRFINEPWTADAFWECQSQMSPDVKPLAFILYADKAKLSSFGREKGYPVIARLANLPVAIRNGKGLGGGRVVGWLPLIKDDPKHKAVWHVAFKKVLASIVPPSTSGRWVNCWDNIARLFYTLVLILSADYEEQAIMSLTRGVMSNFPCPICLIPEDKLSSIMPHNYPLRTGQATSTLLIKARAEHRKGRREAILKSQAIRDVDNAFHDMNHKTTDVHRALSYDHLHVDILSFFGDHMWSKLQLLIGLLGHDKVAQVDEK